MLHLAAEGRREELAAAVVDRINNGTASPLVFDGAAVTARPPFLRLLSGPVPEELLSVDPDALELKCAVDRVEYDDAGRSRARARPRLRAQRGLPQHDASPCRWRGRPSRIYHAAS